MRQVLFGRNAHTCLHKQIVVFKTVYKHTYIHTFAYGYVGSRFKMDLRTKHWNS